MCGIVGIYHRQESPVDNHKLEFMTDSLAHRGPDGRGVWTEASVGLGHRRLSIRDLSEAGSQPMEDSSGRFVLTYNGEVYNCDELARKIASRGGTIKTRCDTEIIVEGFRLFGTDILKELNGIFALAVYDRKHKQLTLARDRYGVKPLHYWYDGSTMIFGSEPKAIRLGLPTKPDLNTYALGEYFHYGAALGKKTLIEGVFRVLPGEYIKITSTGLSGGEFAQSIPTAETNATYTEAMEETRARLLESVKRQLASDVPIGVLLSGGIDSCAIAGVASNILAGEITAYTADFAFANESSEIERAALAARRFGIHHETVRVEPSDLAMVIESMVTSHDEPFGDPASLPINLMMAQLREHTKVVLQGDGGDELFAGYPRYQRLAHERAFRWASQIANCVKPVLPKGGRLWRALRTTDAIGNASPEDRMARIMSQERYGSDPLSMLSDPINELVANPFTRYREMYSRFSGQEWPQMMSFTDVQVILPDIYFPKVDRASMAHGVEVRVPLMDQRLADYVLSLPMKHKLKGGKKSLLLDAARQWIPKEVVNAKKRGFGVPIGRWIKRPLKEYFEDQVFGETIRESGVFNVNEIERRFKSHVRGDADYSLSLYKVLVFAVWYRSYFKP